MSEAEHRQAAAREERLAEQQEARYDPNAAIHNPGPAISPEGTNVGIDYNPTRRFLVDARTHERHAEAHRAAAQALESYEEGECGEFAREVRVICPLMGQLESTAPVEGGVRLTFLSDVDFRAVVDHVRCHMAYGRARGYEGMDACPLYLPGLELREQPETHSIELTSDDPVMVVELRRRAAAHPTVISG